MDWIINNLPVIILSFAALIVSILSWYKTRIFYDLDVHQITGYGSDQQLENIKNKLNTGKYTIINTYEENHPNNCSTVFILVGKIKK